MRITIEPNNGVPIYEQLVRQIKYSIAEGTLVSGQVIPSVREMAKKITVNPNTVQRAYLQLQSEKILQALRGRGMAVTDEAVQICEADRHDLLKSRLQAVVSEILGSGIEESSLQAMFADALQHCQTSRTKAETLVHSESETNE